MLKEVTIGHKDISFKDVCRYLATDQWLEMEGTENGKNCVVNIQFEIKGPGAELCAKCSVFLGSLTYVVYKESQFHARCLTFCMIWISKLFLF